jgi:hypothetical protein
MSDEPDVAGVADVDATGADEDVVEDCAVGVVAVPPPPPHARKAPAGPSATNSNACCMFLDLI